MNDTNLTEAESKNLQQMVSSMEAGEMAQVYELVSECNNPYSFAKTHSNYVKDWEKTRNKMKDNLRKKILPPDTSAAFCGALIEELDQVMAKKLAMVQTLFLSKFNESIFNYLGADGKTKKLFGIFG